MPFDLAFLISSLQNTPHVLRSLLKGLEGELASSSGQHDEWYPFDILGHFIHGEKTDWIPRAQIILSQEGASRFEPFDRLAQFEASTGSALGN